MAKLQHKFNNADILHPVTFDTLKNIVHTLCHGLVFLYGKVGV